MKADAATYKKKYAALDKATYTVNTFPGMKADTYRWPLHQDAVLTFSKYFNEEYSLYGKEARIMKHIDQISVTKLIKIKDVYSSWKIVSKSAMYAIFSKNPKKHAKFWQYGGKFFPVDQESVNIMANHALVEEQQFQAKVVNLSSLTSNELGGWLGKKREKKLFSFLGVPVVDDSGDKEDIKSTDKLGKKLSGHQLDLFRGKPDTDSEDLGFKDAETAKRGIESLSDDDRAHKVRATLLMIQRAKSTLKITKDKDKRKNIKKALDTWLKYKKKIVDK